MVLWEIWTYGEMPYKGWTNKKVAEQVSEGYRLPKPATCPDAVYELMIKCWTKNMKRRVTFSKANQALVEAWNDASREREEYDTADELQDADDYGLYDNHGVADPDGYIMTSMETIYDQGDTPGTEALSGSAQDRIYDSGGTGEAITNLKSTAREDGAEGGVYSLGGEFSTPAGGKRRNIGAEDIGKRVTVAGRGDGVLRYFGPHRKGDKIVCGVELDDECGDHTGTVEGRSYFTCPAKKGVLVDPREVSVEDLVSGLVLNSIYDSEALSPVLMEVLGNLIHRSSSLRASVRSLEKNGYLAVNADDE